MASVADLSTLSERVSIFADFTRTEMEAFLELADPVRYAPGATVVRQDELGDCMFILVDGRAKVIHKRGGREMELATLTAGDFFGELALLDEGLRSASVVALTDCLMLKVPQSVLRVLAGVQPMAAFKLFSAIGRVIVARLRRANAKYIDSLLLSGRRNLLAQDLIND